MAIKTQKTKLYAIDALGTSVLGICATSISVGSASSDEIDITTLCDDTKQYLAGLQESPEVTFTINFDPKIAAHVELLAMKKAGTVTKFALGLSDGVADPTAAAGDFTLPTTRTWVSFDGFIKEFPLDLQGNAVITSQLSIKCSGDFTLTVKA